MLVNKDGEILTEGEMAAADIKDCYYNNFNLKFNMYKYTDKSYFKKAFNTKHDIQLNTNKAYTSIKMT